MVRLAALISLAGYACGFQPFENRLFALGVGLALEPRIGEKKLIVNFGAVSADGSGAFPHLHGFIVTAPLYQITTQVVMRVDVPAAERDGVAQQRFDLGVAILPADDVTELRQRIGVGGLEQERAALRRFRLFECALTTRRDAEKVMRLGDIWKTPGGAFEDIERRIALIEAQVNATESRVVNELRRVLAEHSFIVYFNRCRAARLP